jgi:hypothetical protein
VVQTTDHQERVHRGHRRQGQLIKSVFIEATGGKVSQLAE